MYPRIGINKTLCLLGLLVSTSVVAAPKFNTGVAVEGAIAYQDGSDARQFYYIPTKAGTAVLGNRITSFRATHFGVGKEYFVQDSRGQYHSRSGAMVAATGTIDLSSDQRLALSEAISKAFGIKSEEMRLLPMPVRKSKVDSILLGEVVGFGDTVQQKFPTSLTFGSEFAYSAGSLNSGFAQVVAGMNLNDYGFTPNPTFALNVSGEAEFIGEPWTAKVKCNLGKVWREVRSGASASASFGWFKLGEATYKDIAQNLDRSGACEFNMDEGSLDTEQYGRQVFEMVKKIFEAINENASGGQGFFRFEPNPLAPPVSAGKTRSGLFGLSVSVNLGRSSASLDQNIDWQTTVTYKGRFWHPVYASAVLGVTCNEAAKQYFLDLSDASEPCLTQDKADTFQARAKAESEAKKSKMADLEDRLINGKISIAAYEKLYDYYTQQAISESLAVAELGKFKDQLLIFGVPTPQADALTEVRALTGGAISDVELMEVEKAIIRQIQKE